MSSDVFNLFWLGLASNFNILQYFVRLMFTDEGSISDICIYNVVGLSE